MTVLETIKEMFVGKSLKDQFHEVLEKDELAKRIEAVKDAAELQIKATAPTKKTKVKKQK